MPVPSSPYVLQDASVCGVMLRVLLALIPAIAVHALIFGGAIFVQIAMSTLTALCAEALILKLRKKPLALFLTDGSAIVTAWLIALTFPSIAPWWLVVVGTLFAIVIAKHLYGGLGQNPFNPAMVAFAVCIVSFPALMSQWPAPNQTFANQLARITAGHSVDGISAATPLDTLKTNLKLDPNASVNSIQADHPETYGFIAGNGNEWVALAILLGGLYLIKARIITWHIPLAFLASLGTLSALLWWFAPHQFASPLFHLLAGGTMLGAFFIATDPVSGASTPKGKLIFAAGAGVLVYVIRVFGAYPDGVAFAILLMNIAAPMIDHLTQPPIFGMKHK